MNTGEYVQVVHKQSSIDREPDWSLATNGLVTPNSSSIYGSPGRNASTVRLSTVDNSDVLPLVLYGTLAVFGTTVNIFEISSLVIQENLRHRGNVFLVNQALSNLLVTSVGFPAACISILSGTHRERFVCYWQWYSSLLCFLTSLLNFLSLAVDNFVRTRRRTHFYFLYCGVKVIVAVVCLTWFVAAGWVSLLVCLGGGPDICSRTYGWSPFFLLFLFPVTVTLAFFGKAASDYHGQLKVLELRQCQEGREEALQRNLFKSNVFAYGLFLCLWMPFAFAVSLGPASDHRTVQNLLTLGQSYSCLCGLVYAFSNGSFGQAFIYLTRYFCCKSHPEFTKSFQEKPRGSVRVHIGMETRVGDRTTRCNKMMATVVHKGSSRTQDHFL